MASNNNLNEWVSTLAAEQIDEELTSRGYSTSGVLQARRSRLVRACLAVQNNEQFSGTQTEDSNQSSENDSDSGAVGFTQTEVAPAQPDKTKKKAPRIKDLMSQGLNTNTPPTPNTVVNTQRTRQVRGRGFQGHGNPNERVYNYTGTLPKRTGGVQHSPVGDRIQPPPPPFDPIQNQHGESDTPLGATFAQPRTLRWDEPLATHSTTRPTPRIGVSRTTEQSSHPFDLSHLTHELFQNQPSRNYTSPTALLAPHPTPMSQSCISNLPEPNAGPQTVRRSRDLTSAPPFPSYAQLPPQNRRYPDVPNRMTTDFDPRTLAPPRQSFTQGETYELGANANPNQHALNTTAAPRPTASQNERRDYNAYATPNANFPRPPPMHQPTYHQYERYANAYATPEFRDPYTDSGYGTPNRPTQMRAPNAVSAYDIMRRWNLSFEGGQNAEQFLLRVMEGRQLMPLDDFNLLAGIPFFLKGVPLEWFRCRRAEWRSFDDFVVAFQRRFLRACDQQSLRTEIFRRTQGEDEPVADYLTCMRGLFARTRPPWGEYEKIDCAYQNLLPYLQLSINAYEVYTLDELETVAVQRERVKTTVKLFRPPPTPENSIYADLAYRNPRSRKPRPQANMADETDETDDGPTFDDALAAQTITKNRHSNKNKARDDSKKDAKVEKQASNNKQTSAPNTQTTPQEKQDETSEQPNLVFCWNCRKEAGHFWEQCTAPKTVFCYKCGHQNVTRPKCPICSGNA